MVSCSRNGGGSSGLSRQRHSPFSVGCQGGRERGQGGTGHLLSPARSPRLLLELRSHPRPPPGTWVPCPSGHPWCHPSSTQRSAQTRRSIMGNCVPVTPGILETPGSLDLEGIMGDFSYDDNDTYINDTLLDYDATPCHNRFCPLFQRVAPPFLAATSTTAALATGALLVALAKRPQAWRWPQSRALVAQLALGTALFAALLPALAAGVARGWHLGTGLCRLTHLLWHWSVFAQALLVASGSCGTSWARWNSRSRRLAVALWAAALLLATPAALVSGTAAGTACIRRSVGILAPLYLLHLALCLCLLLLLPAGLLLAALAVPSLRASWASGAGLVWLFLGLWGPYGAGLAGELLLQAGLLEPSCGSFEHFDIALGLSEGLGVLHCGLGPLALLLARRCGRAAGGAGGC